MTTMIHLPIIRHIRYYYYLYRMNQHYEFWRDTFGSLPVYIDRDLAELDKIWRGER